MSKKTKKATKKEVRKTKTRRGRPKKEQDFKLSPKVLRSITALTFYLLSLFVLISFFSADGQLLNSFNRIFTSLFGWGIIFVPVLGFFAGNMLLNSRWYLSRPTFLLGGFILFLSLISLTKSGKFGLELWQSVAVLISTIGAFLFFLSGIIIGILVLWEMSLYEMLSPFRYILKILFKQQTEDGLVDLDPLAEKIKEKEEMINLQTENKQVQLNQEEMQKLAQAKAEVKHIQTDLSSSSQSSILSQAPEKWQLPPISLLESMGNQQANRGDVRQNAQIIERTLQSFGVQAKVVDYNPGPTVTQYAIELAIGTKLSKITSLSNDLALALAAKTGQIRIEAPIPGRSLVGIEVPNISSATVSLKELLASGVMNDNKNKLLVGLGLDVSGENIALDIGKMPHLLIAGQTGSGKSVCLNVFLASILFRTAPSEVKLILVDPKRVELSIYNGIPHLLTPVIVEPEKVVSALKWALAEMDNRYKLLAEVGVRNIEAYNEISGFQAMPYIIIVVDELADVMLFAPSEVEDCINRLAQMARAVGVHLVLATQRPSVDVITGLIKANIPARIAFNVSSMTDSRVILDTPGAEKLLGKGDMLYLPPDQAKPKRLQGAFVSDKEIKKIVEYLKNTGTPVHYTEEVVDKYKSGKLKGGKPVAADNDLAQVDELFKDSVRIICAEKKASASYLQRKLSIGYNRAAKIIDQMQELGVISGPNGAKPREVLIKSADEFFANLENRN
ncbi:DNA translocase FtsK [Candidatus Beckwithbacteria bacterium]|nr:DNA translocase FtsK [Candidatus Beckwithbacteria bacterium]